MQNSLNSNVMDKTSAGHGGSLTSLKKLTTGNYSNAKKAGTPFKVEDRQIVVHTPFHSSGMSVVNGTNNQSPIKLMSMTMPKGFMSPPNV